MSSASRRALLSVSDKTGIVRLARALVQHSFEIISTGGTAQTLREAGIAVIDVSAVTGMAEMMDGRVKTLHPALHGGILFRGDNPSHAADAAKHDIARIDIVVVNLYPFAETVAQGHDREACIENIDIGGPSLIRAAAKNHADVTIVTDPAQYDALIAEMAAHNGATSLPLRQSFANAAFACTAAYDANIAAWFAQQQGEHFPETITITAKRRNLLRYGENPHQGAAFYVTNPRHLEVGIASALQIQGKELSYNNIADAEAALALVSEFTDMPTVAIIKHANPCGVAQGDTLSAAWDRALACDPVSAFGGIVACNRQLDAHTADQLAKIFTEVIIAPDIDDEARQILAHKKNLRVLLTREMPDAKQAGLTVKSLRGGFLVQDRDANVVDAAKLMCVTKRQPSEGEMGDMIFAFTVAKHVRSNAIVHVRNKATVGIGAGQMSRLDSARIAVLKSQDVFPDNPAPLRGSVVASDAFFPFADGLQTLIKAGVDAVIQPGGSVRDAEVIEAADNAGIAMVFTGVRHFAH